MFAKEQKAFLLFLLQGTPKQVKFLLKHLSRQQKLALYEVAYNVLRGAGRLTDDQIRELRKHKQS